MKTLVSVLKGPILSEQDSVYDAKVTGGSDGTGWTVETDKGLEVTGVRNGTSGTILDGDTVTILVPKGDRAKQRIMGRLKRRKATSKIHVV